MPFLIPRSTKFLDFRPVRSRCHQLGPTEVSTAHYGTFGHAWQSIQTQKVKKSKCSWTDTSSAFPSDIDAIGSTHVQKRFSNSVSVVNSPSSGKPLAGPSVAPRPWMFRCLSGAGNLTKGLAGHFSSQSPLSLLPRDVRVQETATFLGKAAGQALDSDLCWQVQRHAASLRGGARGCRAAAEVAAEKKVTSYFNHENMTTHEAMQRQSPPPGPAPGTSQGRCAALTLHAKFLASGEVVATCGAASATSHLLRLHFVAWFGLRSAQWPCLRNGTQAFLLSRCIATSMPEQLMLSIFAKLSSTR